MNVRVASVNLIKLIEGSEQCLSSVAKTDFCTVWYGMCPLNCIACHSQESPSNHYVTWFSAMEKRKFQAH